MPENTDPHPAETTSSNPETTATDFKAVAVAVVSGVIAHAEQQLASLPYVPGHIALGQARSALECALATLRADLAIVGDIH